MAISLWSGFVVNSPQEHSITTNLSTGSPTPTCRRGFPLLRNLFKMGSSQSTMQRRTSNPTQTTSRGDLNSIIESRKSSKDKFRELLGRLIHSSGDVDAKGKDDMTALHFAVLLGEELCAKALIAFGANVNAKNEFCQTPLDIARENQREALVPLLVSVGCETGEVLQNRRYSYGSRAVPRPEEVSGFEVDSPQVLERRRSVQQPEPPRSPESPGRSPTIMSCCPEELEMNIERRFEATMSLTSDEAFAIALQQQEIARCRSTGGRKSSVVPVADTPAPIEFRVQGGSRILSLDGGGIRGLIQIEILSEIERLTGKRIVDLFDWIIGTSTGGILALGLVYRKMSLDHLRKLYFRLKEDVFGQGGIRYGYDTNALEKIIKEEFGTEMKMSDVSYPKVLISAVNKSRTPLKLTFFNNCFGDEFSTQPIWKVGRYTSAAPMYFSECDNYVDGGVLANNPCQDGLSRIQQFYQEKGARLPVACMVSVGSGIYPAEEMGSTRFRVGGVIDGVQNLFRLINSALSNSEVVADYCKSNCEGQSIPFYRFSPQLNERIDPGETDNNKLLEMIIVSRLHMHSDAQLDKLIPLILTHSQH